MRRVTPLFMGLLLLDVVSADAQEVSTFYTNEAQRQIGCAALSSLSPQLDLNSKKHLRNAVIQIEQLRDDVCVPSRSSAEVREISDFLGWRIRCGVPEGIEVGEALQNKENFWIEALDPQRVRGSYGSYPDEDALSKLAAERYSEMMCYSMLEAGQR